MSVSRVIDPRSTANTTLGVTERTDLLVVGGDPAGHGRRARDRVPFPPGRLEPVMSVSRVIDPRSTANATRTVSERTDLPMVRGGAPDSVAIPDRSIGAHHERVARD